MSKISIDGKEVKFEEGQTILEIARKNNIYIPAICYLTGCSPTVACKMCMTEVDGKRLYACNAKAKDGAIVLTQTPEIDAERKMIMQTYDVNHPLECGVCDKSGECELQDMTLRMNISAQPFSVQDDEKPSKEWAQALYDPNLCIMCERCVTTCKDNIGEANLKASKFNLHPVDNFKDAMPKDPFSVWTRKQKGLIDFVGEKPCFDCGECISVCPVGALGYKDFSYTANAWELRKISSTCQHCAGGCFINYEIRHQDIGGMNQKIYRVSNNFNHNPICGAARFAFDISSTPTGSNNLAQAQEKLKKAKAVRIGGDITNEEAYLIEELRKQQGFKVYCEETRKFQIFRNALPQKSLWGIDDVKKSDLIITLGSSLKTESPSLRYAINNALKVSKNSNVIYAHPIKDLLILELSRNILSIQYAPNADEIMLAAIILAYDLHPKNALTPIVESEKTISKTTIKQIKKTIENAQSNDEITQEVEEVVSYLYYGLLESIGLEYDVWNELKEMLQASKSPTIIIGQDIYQHKNAQNIACLLAYLQEQIPIKILLIPPHTNSVGISLICSLDEDNGENDDVVGMRAKGEYIMDTDKYTAKKISKQKVDFILPALNQLEGSLTNFEYKLLPLNAALPFYGYDLSDIAQSFGFEGKSLIDYTHILPKESGYKNIAYDCLKNYIAPSGEERRGYRLDLVKNNISTIPIKPVEPIEIQKIGQHLNAYIKYPQSQFSSTTTMSENLQIKAGIYTSQNYLENLNLKEGDSICLQKDANTLKGKIYIDKELEQDIFIISPCLDEQGIFKEHIFENLHIKEIQ